MRKTGDSTFSPDAIGDKGLLTPMTMSPPPDREQSARRAAARFGAVAASLIAGAMILIVVAGRFDFLGAGFHVKFAMLLGAGGTIAVGVGLMALVFYSSRSGADDEVKQSGADEPPFNP